jgi:protein-tyrosine-phosphatase
LNFSLAHKARLTRLIMMGTSMRDPVTVAKASCEANPKMETVTAIANSKWLLAAVIASAVIFLQFRTFLQRTCIDWRLEDPKGKPIEKVREIRNQIEPKVVALIDQLG